MLPSLFSMRAGLVVVLVLKLCCAQDPIQATLSDLALQFDGVSALSDDSLSTWAQVTKTWFEAAYSGNYSASLFTSRNRDMQVYGAWGSDPSTVGVTNVVTTYSVTGQATNDAGTTTIYFDQDISYTTSNEGDSAAVIAKLPFGYAASKSVYAALLEREVPGFELVGSVGNPFAASPPTSPAIVDEGTTNSTAANTTLPSANTTDAETDDAMPEEEKGVGAGGVIGIIAGALYGIVLAVYGFRLFCMGPSV